MRSGNSDDPAPDADDLAAYVLDRAFLLNKAFTDHLVWEQSLRSFGRDASLAATWVDHDGQHHVVAINRAYLAAHRKIVLSLIGDLTACGPGGMRAVRSVFAVQHSMLNEEGGGYSI
jgi:hypothetical protein